MDSEQLFFGLNVKDDENWQPKNFGKNLGLIRSIEYSDEEATSN